MSKMSWPRSVPRALSPAFAPEGIRSAVEQFRAVEHRLEFVAAIDGVEYYNDSKATNVDASLKAIAAFPDGIHLILGGKDKNSDYRAHASSAQARVKAVYTIGAAAEKIVSQIKDAAANRPLRHPRRRPSRSRTKLRCPGRFSAGPRLFQLRSV